MELHNLTVNFVLGSQLDPHWSAFVASCLASQTAAKSFKQLAGIERIIEEITWLPSKSFVKLNSQY